MKTPRKSNRKSIARTVQAIVVAATTAQTAAVRRAEALLALIERRRANIEEEFFDIGVALAEILKRKLYLAIGFKTFAEMLDARVKLGHSQAAKLVLVATSYDRESALTLRLEKAYQLIRYAEATPAPDSPKFLLASGAKIGRKAIADASVNDLIRATREVQAKTKAARGSDAAEKQRAESARKVQARLRKQGVRSAKVEVVKHKDGWHLAIDVRIEDADRV